ncbi:hypothetical protein LNQ49_06310 [Flavobacterium sp. F-65]|jgi:hypothetical protein|uniref:Uncharacterized protein n=1 Tax=Flavobacterium pisciphilum TaxID=2893755 RepID=A0ABS8MTK3_9FLAO|nr:hypothetical protein [Flavobacterium sp. F-65]MCC9071205.1 hypothetical protein [Flavobacterium sp. F-65]
MKKIFLFLLLIVSLTSTAQKTYSIEKPLQLNTVNEGTKSDSVLVRGADKIVKYIPRSKFGAGSQTLQQTMDKGRTWVDDISNPNLSLFSINDPDLLGAYSWGIYSGPQQFANTPQGWGLNSGLGTSNSISFQAKVSTVSDRNIGFVLDNTKATGIYVLATTSDFKTINGENIVGTGNITMGGSETKVTAGTNTTVTGTGANASPYVISTTIPTLNEVLTSGNSANKTIILNDGSTKTVISKDSLNMVDYTNKIGFLVKHSFFAGKTGISVIKRDNGSSLILDHNNIGALVENNGNYQFGLQIQDNPSTASFTYGNAINIIKPYAGIGLNITANGQATPLRIYNSSAKSSLLIENLGVGNGLQILDKNSQNLFVVKNSGVVNIKAREFSNNSNALAGGLVSGDIYRTSTGVLMIVY